MVISYSISGQCVSGDGHNDKKNLLGVISFPNLEENLKNVRFENYNFDKFDTCQNMSKLFSEIISLDFYPFDSFIDDQSFRLQQG